MEYHIPNEELKFGDYEHFDRCFLLKTKLQAAIDNLMHYIFEGRAEKDEWENLFRALSQAVFMKEYLDRYSTNLLNISEGFIDQYNEWLTQLQVKLN